MNYGSEESIEFYNFELMFNFQELKKLTQDLCDEIKFIALGTEHAVKLVVYPDVTFQTFVDALSLLQKSDLRDSQIYYEIL